jgi:hypothetical protein
MPDPSVRPSSLPLTTVTTSFTQPGPAATVTVAVGNALWMQPTQVVYIESAGQYSVSSVTDAQTVVLTNPGYQSNVVAGTVIGIGAGVYPIGSSVINSTASGLPAQLTGQSGVGDPDGAFSYGTSRASALRSGARPQSGLLINSSSGNSGVVTGLFYGIQPWTTTIITSITLAPGYEGDALAAGVTLTAGQVYQVSFTSIKLTSGLAMIWRGA